VVGKFEEKGKAVQVEARLRERGIELPEAVQPVATYVRFVQTGNLLLISGTGPSDSAPRGKLGQDLTLDQGYAVARDVGLQVISTIKAALGDLDRVKRVVKVLGMVASAPDFYDQPKVMNGCSDLMVEVFGDKGRHARSAIGVGSLPAGVTVEIEAIVEVE
jgi:enamine deaminase RidA (YjgF/YER057c/UK114 family)